MDEVFLLAIADELDMEAQAHKENISDYTDLLRIWATDLSRRPESIRIMDMTDYSVLQDDLAELLRALGLSDHARPYSPHEVMQREVLPAVQSLKSLLKGTVEAHKMTARERESWKKLAELTNARSAAAEARGRKQALVDAADAMDAIDVHGKGWTDCLNDQPHTRATGNCITPPDWLRARAYAAGQDTDVLMSQDCRDGYHGSGCASCNCRCHAAGQTLGEKGDEQG